MFSEGVEWQVDVHRPKNGPVPGRPVNGCQRGGPAAIPGPDRRPARWRPRPFSACRGFAEAVPLTTASGHCSQASSGTPLRPSRDQPSEASIGSRGLERGDNVAEWLGLVGGGPDGFASGRARLRWGKHTVSLSVACEGKRLPKATDRPRRDRTPRALRKRGTSGRAPESAPRDAPAETQSGVPRNADVS